MSRAPLPEGMTMAEKDFLVRIFSFFSCSTAQKRNSENRFVDRPQKATPAKNADIFKTPWVLHLRTEVPKVTITADSMNGLKQKLRDYYQRAKVVTNYFPDGSYLIRCDGSMYLLTKDEITRVSLYPHIVASLDFKELPYAATVEGQIARSRQNSLVRGTKGSLSVKVRTYGTLTHGTKRTKCELDFAVRDGVMIVANVSRGK